MCATAGLDLLLLSGALHALLVVYTAVSDSFGLHAMPSCIERVLCSGCSVDLHSRHPAIVHRDLKSANLLVGYY